MTPATSAFLVILAGIASTTQNHLSKAMQRQGIETIDFVRSRLPGWARIRSADQVHKHSLNRGRAALYVGGVILNNTVFVYHLLVAPLGGTAALYTSMTGMGLIALLIYSTRVMGEAITRQELAGALSILAGALTIGLEGVFRPHLDSGAIDMNGAILALVCLLGGSILLMLFGLRDGSPTIIGLTFGLSAGTWGTLDPFLKVVSQASGFGGVAPGSVTGWVLFGLSFLMGTVAFFVSMWAFYRRARASILMPALNCSYTLVPVFLQVLLLPGYSLYLSTVFGLALIVLGFLLMRGFGHTVPETDAPGEAAGGA